MRPTIVLVLELLIVLVLLVTMGLTLASLQTVLLNRRAVVDSHINGSRLLIARMHVRRTKVRLVVLLIPLAVMMMVLFGQSLAYYHVGLWLILLFVGHLLYDGWRDLRDPQTLEMLEARRWDDTQQP